MTVSGPINFGTAGLSDLTVLTYTNSGLGTPTVNSVSFVDSGDGIYAESGTAGAGTAWQVVSSATAGYSIRGPVGTLTAGGVVTGNNASTFSTGNIVIGNNASTVG